MVHLKICPKGTGDSFFWKPPFFQVPFVTFAWGVFFSADIPTIGSLTPPAQYGGYMLFVNENFTKVREELAAKTSGVGVIQPSFSSIAKESGVSPG